jgi:hypothetical protein
MKAALLLAATVVVADPASPAVPDHCAIPPPPCTHAIDGQEPRASDEPVPEAQVPAPEIDDDPDEDLNLAQPDFTLAALPTSLRLPRHRGAFRVTHRFGRPLAQGSFGNLLENLFGLDSGGLIGLEYRFGLRRGTQVIVHRTSDRTIQFSAQQELREQSDATPIGVTLLATVDGLNNFREHYAPGLGLIVSREVSDRGAVYLQPIWIHNASLVPDVDGDALIVGVGSRWRVSRHVYLVGEAAPRLRRWRQGTAHVSFGVERRAGGHSFQVNVSNGLGTTYSQIARGGPRRGDWYIGFNISRKFY